MDQPRQHIVARLAEVFREVFDDDGIELGDATTANDIDGWDSLMHIILMVATEKEFGLRINAAEIGALGDVGALIDLVAERATK